MCGGCIDDDDDDDDRESELSEWNLGSESLKVAFLGFIMNPINVSSYTTTTTTETRTTKNVEDDEERVKFTNLSLNLRSILKIFHRFCREQPADEIKTNSSREDFLVILKISSCFHEAMYLLISVRSNAILQLIGYITFVHVTFSFSRSLSLSLSLSLQTLQNSSTLCNPIKGTHTKMHIASWKRKLFLSLGQNQQRTQNWLTHVSHPLFNDSFVSHINQFPTSFSSFSPSIPLPKLFGLPSTQIFFLWWLFGVHNQPIVSSFSVNLRIYSVVHLYRGLLAGLPSIVFTFAVDVCLACIHIRSQTHDLTPRCP